MMDGPTAGQAGAQAAELAHSLDGAARAAGETLLWETAHRMLRQPRNKLAIVLHLSHLRRPAPKPHHVRISRAMLHQAAQRFGGQVFLLRNHDIVLLCGQDALHETDQGNAPANVPAMLEDLFAAEMPRSGPLVSVWPLDRAAEALLSYLAGHTDGTGEVALPEEDRVDLSRIAAVPGNLAVAPLGDLMTQQVGMSLSADRGKPLVTRLSPAFCELAVSAEALQSGRIISAPLGDHFLTCHLAGAIEAEILKLLLTDLVTAGPLTRPARLSALPLHLEFGLRTIFSPAFTRFAREAKLAGLQVRVAVPLMQAAADLDMLHNAAHLLRLTGCGLVISDIGLASLGLIRPDALAADLVKLAWSPVLAEPNSAVAAALSHLGPSNTVLQGVDTDQALAWGQSLGITLFQGPFLDQVQAATRMAGCQTASPCTLRQCRIRAASPSGQGRTGCASPQLLDPVAPGLR